MFYGLIAFALLYFYKMKHLSLCIVFMNWAVQITVALHFL